MICDDSSSCTLLLFCHIIFEEINMIYLLVLFPFTQVFSAFGFVHKIATFEKAAGFQVRQ